MTTPIDTHSEQHRLECLARYWLTRPRANAQAWLNSQQVAFREQMRELMNQEQQKRRESRTMTAARPKPISAPRTTQARRKPDAVLAAPPKAERRTSAQQTDRTSLDEMLGGFRG